jgi:hypothetical protein
MKFVNKVLAVTVSALAAGAAVAQDSGWQNSYGRGNDGQYSYGPYFGFNVGQFRYHEEGLDTITPTLAMFVIGAPVSPYLAVEGRIGRGLGIADTNSFKLDVNSVFAGYLKGMLPLGPNVSLYGLAGVASLDYQRDFGQVNARDSGFSYGVGMGFDLGGRSRLNFEWVRLATGNNLGYDYTVDQAAIGMAWRF